MRSQNINIRNRDFVRCCRRRLKELNSQGQFPDITTLVIDVLRKPAPTYYVDYYQANRRLIPVIEGRAELPAGTYSSGRVWADMLADLRAIMSKHPGRKPREVILELCNGVGGNPRFYISVRRAVDIVRPFFDNSVTLILA